MAEALLPRVQAALHRYRMIAPGDRVAVGVSGGKDSVALLDLLAKLREFYPVPFTITAITLDPGFDGVCGDYGAVADLCETKKIPYILRRTHIYDAVFRDRREKNPCSFCARFRRGALHQAAQEAGCGVVALGHHQDDAAETFLMNLLDGGRLGCFSPKTELDRRGLTLIRPLIFLEEREIAAYVRKEGLPVVKSRCPADGHTRRQEMKTLLRELSGRYGPLEPRIIGAMQKAGLDGWGDRPDETGCMAERPGAGF